MLACKGCGKQHGGASDYCRTCKFELRRLTKQAHEAGLDVGSGSTYGWVFDRIGRVLAHNERNTLCALRTAMATRTS